VLREADAVSEHIIPSKDLPPTKPPTPPPAPPPEPSAVFERRLTMATLGLLFFVLFTYLLTTYAAILQPLFIAVFIAYAVRPLHQWLVGHHVPSLLAYLILLALTLGFLVGVGALLYVTVEDLTRGGLDVYEAKVDTIGRQVLGWIPTEVPNRTSWRVRNLFTAGGGYSAELQSLFRTVLGGSFNFLLGGFVVFVYLLFVIAEQASLPHRLGLAFGGERATYLLGLARSVNDAIAQYISVKTWVSLVTGFLSLVVMWPFGVKYFLLWAFLIFLFNYIPYIGSLVAVLLPVALSFLQFDDLWKPAVIGVLLISIQQFTGNFLEPRLTGKRLNVSPVVVLLALAFWGAVWGIVGMVLAVPLIVVAKIVLENIPETRPIAMLMSNR
jgi:AI-2 transport protein TqsA